jgi:hypothetical protein
MRKLINPLINNCLIFKSASEFIPNSSTQISSISLLLNFFLGSFVNDSLFFGSQGKKIESTLVLKLFSPTLPLSMMTKEKFVGH